MIHYICVWHNLNNNTYYYRIIKWYNENYYVGFVNDYNHELIIYDEINMYVEKVLIPNYRKLIAKKLISLLEKV